MTRTLEPGSNHNTQFHMSEAIRIAQANPRLMHAVDLTTELKHRKRIDAINDTFGDDADAIKHLAGQIRRNAVEHYQDYLEQFIQNATQAGARVHLAKNAAEARDICLTIAQDNKCQTCVKSKSMVTEEIDLRPHFIQHGIHTIETDLGEFIVQLDDDTPSHIVTPMIHKDRTDVANAFTRELGVPYTIDPAAQTVIARQYLRTQFIKAEVGIIGANFLVADTGSIILCTNEGNGCLTSLAPPVQIAVTGIEKVIPNMQQAAVLLKLLARSATAQPLTVYTNIITGVPKSHSDKCQLHIVLVDNGRSDVHANPEARDLLCCIRCGACLNACPVFRHVGGGHAYGNIYSGPIGQTLVPTIDSLQKYKDLPQACSLCGACADACPVQIPLPEQIIRLRCESVDNQIIPRHIRTAYYLYGRMLSSKWTYELANEMTRLFLRAIAVTSMENDPYQTTSRVTRSDDRDSDFAPAMFPPMSHWVRYRDLPCPPESGFRQYWKTQHPQSSSNDEHHTAVPQYHTTHTTKHSRAISNCHNLEIARKVSPDTANNHALLFVKRATANGMIVHQVTTDTIQQSIVTILDDLAAIESCVINQHDPELAVIADSISELYPSYALDYNAYSDMWQHVHSMVGVTGVISAVAETGSIMLSDLNNSRNGVWLVPEVHIAIVRANQIVPDLLDLPGMQIAPDHIEGKKSNAISHSILISGPSKTADIEGILITGVHGPREVHVMLLDDG